MALPGHRRTSSDRDRRSAHFALKKKNIAECSNCKQPVLAHRACANCGTYKGRQVINTNRKMARVLSKAQAKMASSKPVVEKKEKKSDSPVKSKAEKKEVAKDSKKDASKK